MTRSWASHLLPVIEAWSQGKAIQWRNPNCDWSDLSGDVNFDRDGEWRLKPEPREFWLVLADGPGSRIIKGLYKKPDDGLTPDSSIIHVREVINE